MATHTEPSIREIFDNADWMVGNDVLMHGEYYAGELILSEEPVCFMKNRSHHGVCGGVNACLVGTLWLAGGVRTTADGGLPNVCSEGDRYELLNERPNLKAVYEAVNEVAVAMVESGEIELKDEMKEAYDANGPGAWGSFAEALFENGPETNGKFDYYLPESRVPEVLDRARELLGVPREEFKGVEMMEPIEARIGEPVELGV